MLLWTFVYKCPCGHLFSFLLGVYLEVGFSGSWDNSVFNSLRSYQTVSYPRAALPLCIPGSFYTSSPRSLRLFIPAVLVAVTWYLADVISISLMADGVEHLFHGLVGHFLGEISVQILCLFLNWVFFLLFSHRSSLYILDTNAFMYVICRYFISFCGLPSHSLMASFEAQKALHFEEIHFVFFSLLLFILWRHSKSFAKSKVVKIYACLFLRVL